MARSRQATSYGKTPFGKLDADFCNLMSEILAWDIRADVRRSAAMVALWSLTRCWPSAHFRKTERDRWTHKATAAFRVSERELAELCGFSRPRVHRALKALREGGFIVELAPAKPLGEGRGTAPATCAFACHLGISAKAVSVSSVSASSEAPDPPQPVQAWR